MYIPFLDFLNIWSDNKPRFEFHTGLEVPRISFPMKISGYLRHLLKGQIWTIHISSVPFAEMMFRPLILQQTYLQSQRKEPTQVKNLLPPPNWAVINTSRLIHKIPGKTSYSEYRNLVDYKWQLFQMLLLSIIKKLVSNILVSEGTFAKLCCCCSSSQQAQLGLLWAFFSSLIYKLRGMSSHAL